MAKGRAPNGSWNRIPDVVPAAQAVRADAARSRRSAARTQDLARSDVAITSARDAEPKGVAPVAGRAAAAPRGAGVVGEVVPGASAAHPGRARVLPRRAVRGSAVVRA